MKKIFTYLLIALTLSAVSCRRAAENAARKIRIEAVEEFRLRGLTGAEMVLRVANGTSHKLVLNQAEFSLYYNRNRAATIRLHESVEVGKRTTERVTTRWKLKTDDPLAMLLIVREIHANDPSQIYVSYALDGRGGPAHVNIAREMVPLSEFLNIFGITLQDVQQYIRPHEN